MIRVITTHRWRKVAAAAARLEGLAADAAGTEKALHQERAARKAAQAECEQLRQHLAERAVEARVEVAAHIDMVARLESRVRELERVVEAQRERLARRRQTHRDVEAELAAALARIGELEAGR